MRRRHQEEVTETTTAAAEESTKTPAPKPSARLISTKAQSCGKTAAVQRGGTRTVSSPSDKVWCNCKEPKNRTI